MMQRLVAELIALALPAYVFLQLFTLLRYRRTWRLVAGVPLLLMVPLGVHAAVAFLAGSPLWLALIILAAPVACVYLLAVTVAKAVMT